MRRTANPVGIYKDVEHSDVDESDSEGAGEGPEDEQPVRPLEEFLMGQQVFAVR